MEELTKLFFALIWFVVCNLFVKLPKLKSSHLKLLHENNGFRMLKNIFFPIFYLEENF